MLESKDYDLSRLRGMTVLLAEDNVTNQLVATQMLENLGATVDVASDGAIALERLAQNSYDILLVDIEMPRVSGLDVIRSVRSSEGDLAKAPVIALTAYAMQEHREKIRKAGADGLIPKPIISIEQFGADILNYMDEGVRRRAAPVETDLSDGPTIESSIFDSLAETIGPEAMVDLLGKIEIDLRTVKSQIIDANNSADMDLMRSATHVLISVAGAVGGVRLQNQAERMNALAHAGDFANIATLTDEALVELEGVLDYVADKLKAGDA